MPLCVLLWIIIGLPVAMVAWVAFAHMVNMDGDTGVSGLILLSLLLCIAAPNLLWYKAVRDVMSPAPVEVTLER